MQGQKELEQNCTRPSTLKVLGRMSPLPLWSRRLCALDWTCDYPRWNSLISSTYRRQIDCCNSADGDNNNKMWEIHCTEVLRMWTTKGAV